MITITLLIMFNKKKYTDMVLPALEELKKGKTKRVEELITQIDKKIVVDFWDFSDIPEDDNEFSGFFDDFILALEQEILQSGKLPENIDEATLRRMIIDMVKGSKGEEVMLPEEILKRIAGVNNNPIKSDPVNTSENDLQNHDNNLSSVLEDEQPSREEELGILEHEIKDIIKQVKKTGKADPDTVMYFKARLIEAFCIPVNKVLYRYDLSGNLLNVFLFSLSTKAKDLLKNKQKVEFLAPKLNPEDKEIAEDIFEKSLGIDNIINLMAILDSLTMKYSSKEEFDELDKILRRNIKGEWWNKMNEAEKRIRLNNWWNEMENLKMFLQGALDHGYDILVSNI